MGYLKIKMRCSVHPKAAQAAAYKSISVFLKKKYA